MNIAFLLLLTGQGRFVSTPPSNTNLPESSENRSFPTQRKDGIESEKIKQKEAGFAKKSTDDRFKMALEEMVLDLT